MDFQILVLSIKGQLTELSLIVVSLRHGNLCEDVVIERLSPQQVSPSRIYMCKMDDGLASLVTQTKLSY